MQKKFLWIIAIILFISFTSFTAESKEHDEINQLTNVFNSSGAEIEGYFLHVGIPYGNSSNDQLLFEQGNKLSMAFDLPEVDRLTANGQELVYVSNGTWGSNTEVELQLKRLYEDSDETYLVFKLKGTNDLNELEKHYKRLTEMLQKLQIYPKINTCLQGTINDKLNNDHQLVLIEDLLHRLEAGKVEQLDTRLVKSVSAYSPLFPYTIWTGQKEMNLQIATHYDSLNKKTVLTMGTPIITIEY